MIQLGILTVRQEKSGFWQKIRTPVILKEKFITQAHFLVGEFSWTKEEVRRLPLWLARRLYARGQRFLTRQGCVGIAPDVTCSASFSLRGEKEIGLICTIPPEKITECVCWFLAQGDVAVPSRAYVKCRHLSALKQGLLDNLCLRVQSLAFCTEEIEKAHKLAEKLCTEYGFYPEIRDITCHVPSRAMLIDLDAGVVRMGRDAMADGMEVAMDLHDYCVNQGTFWGDLPLPLSQMKFVSWTRGKKRLTIQ